MSSELEMHEAGRLRLASLFAAERAKPIREAGYRPWREDIGRDAMAALANEERRLKLAARRKR